MDVQSEKNELESSKMTFAAFKPQPQVKAEPKKYECCINTTLRGRVWKVLCKLDEVKDSLIHKFNTTQGHSLEPFLRSCLINQLSEQQISVHLKTEPLHISDKITSIESTLQLEFDENQDQPPQVERVSEVELPQAVKMIFDPKSLYEHYRDHGDAEVFRKINKDLDRTQIGNINYKIDPKTGKNMLFNVLNAYAMYDHQTCYCQGMNFIVALLLTHL